MKYAGSEWLRSAQLRAHVSAGKTLLAILFASFAMGARVEPVEGASPGRDSGPRVSFAMEGVSDWMQRKFSEAELQRYERGDFHIEHHLCNCSDQPVPHYPYVMLLFSTPKGDLVTRPERRGFDAVAIPLAVRHGQRYCDVEAEDRCYGSFADPCDFSDFKFGAQLAPYFPTCMEGQ